MTTRPLPQNHCYDQDDHPAHTVRSQVYPFPAREQCPGRYTPRLHGGLSGDPAPGWTPEDPFAGLDEDDRYL
jgi:hypothetical protein